MKAPSFYAMRTECYVIFNHHIPAMVYRVIDEHSGTTVSQSPDEALLRLRAYARQSELELQTEAKGSSNAQIRPSQQSAQTDQTALAPSQTSGPTGVLIPRPSKTV